MWRTISSSIIFKHPRITLIEDVVELPNGQQTTYLRFGDHGGSAVTIIAINEDGAILVEQEYSHPPKRWLYQFPGGGVPAGEDPADGANRELMEECNLRGELTYLGNYMMLNRRSASPMHVFIARNLRHEEREGDPEEFIRINWLSEIEIDRLIANGNVENGSMLAAWAMYKARRE